MKPSSQEYRRRLDSLGTMLTYRRPAGSGTERHFIRQYLAPLNASRDAFGNWHVVIGDVPVLWSAHLDTVHRREGRQYVTIDRADCLHIATRSLGKSNCLGADDTVGVFLLLELIRAGIPGRYVFHHCEEQGCIGSRNLADGNPGLLQAYQYAIAFDRAGYRDVITHQCGLRTASDLFADALADRLQSSQWRLKYAPCDRGVFTDTESYAGLIPECTNISVGYFHAHSSREYVDFRHVNRLLTAFIDIGATIADLPVDRDLTIVAYDDRDCYSYGFRSYAPPLTDDDGADWNRISGETIRYSGETIRQSIDWDAIRKAIKDGRIN